MSVENFNDSNDQDLDFNLLKLSFIKDGEDKKILLAHDDADILLGLKSFLSVMSSNGIYLDQDTFDQMLEDIGCQEFEDPDDIKGVTPISLKANLHEQETTSEKAFDDFIYVLEGKNKSLSEETIAQIEGCIADNDNGADYTAEPDILSPQ